jgi:hypothetical protein
MNFTRTEYTTISYCGIKLICKCYIENFQDESGTADYLSLIEVNVGDDNQNIIDILKQSDVDSIQAVCLDKLI